MKRAEAKADPNARMRIWSESGKLPLTIIEGHSPMGVVPMSSALMGQLELELILLDLYRSPCPAIVAYDKFPCDLAIQPQNWVGNFICIDNASTMQFSCPRHFNRDRPYKWKRTGAPSTFPCATINDAVVYTTISDHAVGRPSWKAEDGEGGGDSDDEEGGPKPAKGKGGGGGGGSAAASNALRDAAPDCYALHKSTLVIRTDKDGDAHTCVSFCQLRRRVMAPVGGRTVYDRTAFDPALLETKPAAYPGFSLPFIPTVWTALHMLDRYHALPDGPRPGAPPDAVVNAGLAPLERYLMSPAPELIYHGAYVWAAASIPRGDILARTALVKEGIVSGVPPAMVAKGLTPLTGTFESPFLTAGPRADRPPLPPAVLAKYGSFAIGQIMDLQRKGSGKGKAGAAGGAGGAAAAGGGAGGLGGSGGGDGELAATGGGGGEGETDGQRRVRTSRISTISNEVLRALARLIPWLTPPPKSADTKSEASAGIIARVPSAKSSSSAAAAAARAGRDDGTGLGGLAGLAAVASGPGGPGLSRASSTGSSASGSKGSGAVKGGKPGTSSAAAAAAAAAVGGAKKAAAAAAAGGKGGKSGSGAGASISNGRGVKRSRAAYEAEEEDEESEYGRHAGSGRRGGRYAAEDDEDDGYYAASSGRGGGYGRRPDSTSPEWEDAYYGEGGGGGDGGRSPGASPAPGSHEGRRYTRGGRYSTYEVEDNDPTAAATAMWGGYPEPTPPSAGRYAGTRGGTTASPSPGNALWGYEDEPGADYSGGGHRRLAHPQARWSASMSHSGPVRRNARPRFSNESEMSLRAEGGWTGDGYSDAGAGGASRHIAPSSPEPEGALEAPETGGSGLPLARRRSATGAAASGSVPRGQGRAGYGPAPHLAASARHSPEIDTQQPVYRVTEDGGVLSSAGRAASRAGGHLEGAMSPSSDHAASALQELSQVKHIVERSTNDFEAVREGFRGGSGSAGGGGNGSDAGFRATSAGLAGLGAVARAAAEQDGDAASVSSLGEDIRKEDVGRSRGGGRSRGVSHSDEAAARGSPTAMSSTGGGVRVVLTAVPSSGVPGSVSRRPGSASRDGLVLATPSGGRGGAFGSGVPRSGATPHSASSSSSNIAALLAVSAAAEAQMPASVLRLSASRGSGAHSATRSHGGPSRPASRLSASGSGAHDVPSGMSDYGEEEGSGAGVTGSLAPRGYRAASDLAEDGLDEEASRGSVAGAGARHGATVPPAASLPAVLSLPPSLGPSGSSAASAGGVHRVSPMPPSHESGSGGGAGRASPPSAAGNGVWAPRPGAPVAGGLPGRKTAFVPPASSGAGGLTSSVFPAAVASPKASSAGGAGAAPSDASGDNNVRVMAVMVAPQPPDPHRGKVDEGNNSNTGLGFRLASWGNSKGSAVAAPLPGSAIPSRACCSHTSSSFSFSSPAPAPSSLSPAWVAAFWATDVLAPLRVRVATAACGWRAAGALAAALLGATASPRALLRAQTLLYSLLETGAAPLASARHTRTWTVAPVGVAADAPLAAAAATAPVAAAAPRPAVPAATVLPAAVGPAAPRPAVPPGAAAAFAAAQQAQLQQQLHQRAVAAAAASAAAPGPRPAGAGAAAPAAVAVAAAPRPVAPAPVKAGQPLPPAPAAQQPRPAAPAAAPRAAVPAPAGSAAAATGAAPAAAARVATGTAAPPATGAAAAPGAAPAPAPSPSPLPPGLYQRVLLPNGVVAIIPAGPAGVGARPIIIAPATPATAAAAANAVAAAAAAAAAAQRKGSPPPPGSGGPGGVAPRPPQPALPMVATTSGTAIAVGAPFYFPPLPPPPGAAAAGAGAAAGASGAPAPASAGAAAAPAAAAAAAPATAAAAAAKKAPAAASAASGGVAAAGGAVASAAPAAATGTGAAPAAAAPKAAKPKPSGGSKPKATAAAAAGAAATAAGSSSAAATGTTSEGAASAGAATAGGLATSAPAAAPSASGAPVAVSAAAVTASSSASPPPPPSTTAAPPAPSPAPKKASSGGSSKPKPAPKPTGPPGPGILPPALAAALAAAMPPPGLPPPSAPLSHPIPVARILTCFDPDGGISGGAGDAAMSSILGDDAVAVFDAAARACAQLSGDSVSVSSVGLSVLTQARPVIDPKTGTTRWLSLRVSIPVDSKVVNASTSAGMAVSHTSGGGGGVGSSSSSGGSSGALKPKPSGDKAKKASGGSSSGGGDKAKKASDKVKTSAGGAASGGASSSSASDAKPGLSLAGLGGAGGAADGSASGAPSAVGPSASPPSSALAASASALPSPSFLPPAAMPLPPPSSMIGAPALGVGGLAGSSSARLTRAASAGDGSAAAASVASARWLDPAASLTDDPVLLAHIGAALSGGGHHAALHQLHHLHLGGAGAGGAGAGGMGAAGLGGSRVPSSAVTPTASLTSRSPTPTTSALGLGPARTGQTPPGGGYLTGVGEGAASAALSGPSAAVAAAGAAGMVDASSSLPAFASFFSLPPVRAPPGSMVVVDSGIPITPAILNIIEEEEEDGSGGDGTPKAAAAVSVGLGGGGGAGSSSMSSSSSYRHGGNDGSGFPYPVAPLPLPAGLGPLHALPKAALLPGSGGGGGKGALAASLGLGSSSGGRGRSGSLPSGDAAPDGGSFNATTAGTASSSRSSPSAAASNMSVSTVTSVGGGVGGAASRSPSPLSGADASAVAAAGMQHAGVKRPRSPSAADAGAAGWPAPGAAALGFLPPGPSSAPPSPAASLPFPFASMRPAANRLSGGGVMGPNGVLEPAPVSPLGAAALQLSGEGSSSGSSSSSITPAAAAGGGRGGAGGMGLSATTSPEGAVLAAAGGLHLSGGLASSAATSSLPPPFPHGPPAFPGVTRSWSTGDLPDHPGHTHHHNAHHHANHHHGVTAAGQGQQGHGLFEDFWTMAGRGAGGGGGNPSAETGAAQPLLPLPPTLAGFEGSASVRHGHPRTLSDDVMCGGHA